MRAALLAVTLLLLSSANAFAEWQARPFTEKLTEHAAGLLRRQL